MLHIYKVVAVVFLLSVKAISSSAQVCEWRLANPVYNPVDPDGAGPATGTVSFTLQVHTTSGTITQVSGISVGWCWQTANAMLPTGINCGLSVPPPSNVTVNPVLAGLGFTYNNVDQCSGTVNFSTGGETFNRRSSGSFDGGVFDLSTTWVDLFTVTLWSLGSSAPHGGYVALNSSGVSPNVPAGIAFGSYALSDVPGGEYVVNSLTYTSPLPLVTGPVPVTFSRYDVKCSDRGTALTWSTSVEYNSNYFEVEKSANGSGTDWKAIGRTPAAGSSAIQQNYQYLDLEAGAAAYRIRQVDLNGRATYTDIKRSSCEAKSINVLLYPIPAKDRLTVAIRSSRAARTNLNVIDATGRIVLRQSNTIINAGSNNVLLDVHTLPAGEYILVSSDPSVYINQKFVIAR
ncbi:T9SS type A sorting domain-containing protein [Ferruginibacter sp. HRS2-29]|uniref:T9SS type A sorting domain-containing protein n=1 Tax=Ferruginibacter sp. HRS2-29 TaxID=2487334 RepID=UPI0020CB9417|nr:T9SS type A sorting domain-containing protein [Ferruginibacter sp. HRS2-29]